MARVRRAIAGESDAETAPHPSSAAIVRAIRMARGVTQEGWGAQIGYSRWTVRRWEHGVSVPDAAAEEAILAYCDTKGLWRTFERGPLRGLTLTPELLRDVLARERVQTGSIVWAPSSSRRAVPAAPTSFIGRADDLARLRRLAGTSRLITLTGPSGVGKTRLALELADVLAGDFADGVAVISLAAVGDPGLVVQAIAQTLGVREAPDRSLKECLIDALRDTAALLVLDNFEHLIDAAPLVGELVGACPGLTAWVTSREPLRLRGEQEFAVQPLSLPDPAHPPAAEALHQYEAVALFVERVRDVRPDFVLNVENGPSVAELCRRLDGLPLAIELAAARAKVLSPQAMLTRMSSRLAVLSRGARDLPARHRTLRDAIAWSYDLLAPEEQALFRRLAVFTGGCTLQAANVVAVPSSEFRVGGDTPGRELETRNSELAILDGMAALVDKSMLVQREGAKGEPRFAMLETIREFAQEHLQASGEAEAIRDRHLEFFLSLAERAESTLPSGEAGVVVASIESEYDNLMAALTWSLRERRGDDRGLRLAAALGPFWSAIGAFTEGRRWLDEALALPAATARTRPRAKALHFAGTLANLQGDLAVAYSRLEESVGLWRALGDKQNLAATLYRLGAVARNRGDLSSARASLEECVALWREIGNVTALGRSLHYLATAQTDLNLAQAIGEESLALLRRADNAIGIGNALSSLGIFAFQSGDYTRAETLLTESVSLLRSGAPRALGMIYDLVPPLHFLGHLAEVHGDRVEAAARHAEALLIAKEYGDRRRVAMSLEAIAGTATALGQPARAARLLGAGHVIKENVGFVTGSGCNHDHYVAAVRARLDEEAWATAYEQGRAMSLDAAIAIALEQAEALASRQD